ncbi:MAG: adenylate/guanylate cyclase domain-containing protein [Thermoleophilia bacterium]|nr:adenylate/guanylate cyclase domain-containing protein [Thermoleophilia bacterium]
MSFADLVGFTAMGESADPEDLDALLGRYQETGRRVIESRGGTVKTFVGDAVAGVLGVPTAHEDDAERAVRAGLRLLEALEGMTRPDGGPLEVRHRHQHRRGPGAPRRGSRQWARLRARRRRQHGGAPAGGRPARRRRRRRAHPRADQPAVRVREASAGRRQEQERARTGLARHASPRARRPAARRHDRQAFLERAEDLAALRETSPAQSSREL